MNKNTKTIASLVLSAVVAGALITVSSADFEGKGFSFDKTEMNQMFKKGYNGGMKGLTDEDKTSLESMTDEEKKAFFEAKSTERKAEMENKKAERESHEAIIDKLINGEELSADEKVILEEIKIKRAERKAERLVKGGEMGKRGMHFNK